MAREWIACLALLQVAAVAAAAPLVTRMDFLRPPAYHGVQLAEGTMAYTDRGFPLKDIPAAMAGATYLAFPNDLKAIGLGGARFTLARPATVYLCYDARDQRPAGWVARAGFARTDMQLTVAASGVYQFDVYRKDLPAGPVALGPNEDPAGAGRCMYGVAAAEPSAPAADAPPLVADVAYSCGDDFHGIRLEDHARAYFDRAFSLTAIPAPLAGAVCLPTLAGSADSTVARIAVELSAGAAVYVGFAGTPPRWAAADGFRRTDHKLTVTGLARSPDFDVTLYERKAPRGRLVLGPNRDADRTAGGMYLVLVRGTAEQNADGVRPDRIVRREPVTPDNPRTVWCDDADQWVATVFAGNPSIGPGFQQGPLLESTAPGSLLFAPDGQIYATAGTVVTTIRDGRHLLLAGVPGVAGRRDGPAAEALFGEIGPLAWDRGGLVVLDRGNLCFRRMAKDAAGRWVVSTVAGVPGEQGRRDGPADKALFRQLWGMAVDPAGRIYCFDDDWLRRIADGRVQTLNPDGGKGYQDGPLAAARFAIYPGGGCCMDEHGVLFLADRINRCIRRIDLAAGQVSTVCSAPIQVQLSYHDGPAPLAAFHDSPGYICYDPVRKCLYTNGVDESCIRRLAGGWLKTLAGLGRQLTGPAKEIGMLYPSVVGIDPAGNLYIQDGAHRGLIRKLTFVAKEAK